MGSWEVLCPVAQPLCVKPGPCMCVVLVCKGPPCHSSQYTSGWLYTGQLGGLSHTALQLHSDDQPRVYIFDISDTTPDRASTDNYFIID